MPKEAEPPYVEDQDQIDALDALRPAYDVKHIGDCEVWVRGRE